MRSSQVSESVRALENRGETAATRPFPSTRIAYECSDGAASEVVLAGDGTAGTVAIAESNDRAVVVPDDCSLESEVRFDGLRVVHG